eukprot:scaffold54458_cov36-Cyclotella_meneghiniana.AAC.5
MISALQIARHINEYLLKDGEVYKGFGVIVDNWEVKKKNKVDVRGGNYDDVQKKQVKTEGEKAKARNRVAEGQTQKGVK